MRRLKDPPSHGKRGVPAGAPTLVQACKVRGPLTGPPRSELLPCLLGLPDVPPDPRERKFGLLSPLTPMPWVLPVAILCLQTLLILRFTFCRLHHLLNCFIQLCLWIRVWDPTDRSGQGHCITIHVQHPHFPFPFCQDLSSFSFPASPSLLHPPPQLPFPLQVSVITAANVD